MKLVLIGLLIFLIFSQNSCKKVDLPNEFVGSIELNSQDAVNEFGKNNYEIIVGYLKIRDTTGTSITSLKPLYSIKEIGNTLYIHLTRKLDSLEGLNNLTSVGSIDFQSNYGIKNLNALKNLKTIKTYFTLSNSPNLNSIDGISQLESKTLQSVSIYGCNISDLRAFKNVEIIVSLSLNNCYNLKTLDGLENLTMISRFQINNVSLVSLSGLSMLKTINTSFSIESCSQLTTLNGIDNLQIIGDIYNNFSNSLFIYNNSLLSDFCALKPFFLNNGSTTTILIDKNLSNPTPEEIINSCE